MVRSVRQRPAFLRGAGLGQLAPSVREPALHRRGPNRLRLACRTLHRHLCPSARAKFPNRTAVEGNLARAAVRRICEKEGTQGGRLDPPSILVPSKRCVILSVSRQIGELRRRRLSSKTAPGGREGQLRRVRISGTRGVVREGDRGAEDCAFSGRQATGAPSLPRCCSRLEGLHGRACTTEWRFSPVGIV